MNNLQRESKENMKKANAVFLISIFAIK